MFRPTHNQASLHRSLAVQIDRRIIDGYPVYRTVKNTINAHRTGETSPVHVSPRVVSGHV